MGGTAAVPFDLQEMLAQALRGGQDPNAAPAGTPGQMNGGGPIAMNGGGPLSIPSTPSPASPKQQLQSAMTPIQAAPQVPPPTDDPGMVAAPKPPDLSISPAAAALKKYQDDLAARNAIPRPDPSQLKPRLWERILGGVLGATQLRNPENAGAVAGSVVNRRMLGAQRDYDIKTAPLDRQLEQERQGFPMVEAAAKIPQQDFENKMQVSKESTSQFTAKANAANKQDIADIRQQITSNNLDKAQNLLDQKQKELEARTSQSKDSLDLRRQLGELSLALKSKQLDEQAEKNQQRADPNGYTASENREISSRSRRFNTRIDSLEKARRDYVGSDSPQDKKSLAAIDAEIEQNHQELDKVEKEVTSRRPSATAAPTAQPTVTPKGNAPATKPGKALTDKAKAQDYLQKAGGDKNKARSLARADGYAF